MTLLSQLRQYDLQPGDLVYVTEREKPLEISRAGKDGYLDIFDRVRAGFFDPRYCDEDYTVRAVYRPTWDAFQGAPGSSPQIRLTQLHPRPVSPELPQEVETLIREHPFAQGEQRKWLYEYTQAILRAVGK